ncbi:MAG: Gfo/Idh/MocA family oxidoreductase [Propionibacteriaceae bacterium]|jgi:predicted dehydrogenase|nr:Gfo/Idh/MocA family oxidoreductase [Propionibacteriaceae bacterium]
MSQGISESVTALRALIVGSGMIGNVHRRSAILAGAQVVGVVEKDEESARAAAERWGVLDYFDDLVTALDAVHPDVVHICTPNATHGEFSRLALEAGCHVVCEKPLTLDVAEGQALADLAEANGLVAAVPYVYRYHPLVREIRSRRIAGEFGSIHMLHGHYLQDWLLSPDASSWRVDPAAGGASRAFADIGSHWCDLIEWVSGQRITELVADTAIAIPERPAEAGPTFTTATPTTSAPKVKVTTEDISNILFRTDAGTPGTLTVSQVSAGRKNRLWFELDGEHSSAVFDQENPETVWLGALDKATILFRDPGYGSAESRRLTVTPSGHVQGWLVCFEEFVADTYATIRGGNPEGLPTFADGVRSLKIVAAVLGSAKSRAWKEV